MSGNGVDATPDLPDPRQLARLISRTRREFGNLYDATRPDDASRSFLVVSEATPLDSVAFERALRQSAEEGWFEALAAGLLEADFLPAEAAVVTELQAVIERSRGFADVSLVTAGSIMAQNRLCQVEVTGGPNGGSTTGTGFLIGPSAVLTCFHVVESLVDVNAGEPKAGTSRAITVRFDHRSGRTSEEMRVPDDWLLAWSQVHPAELKSVEAGDQVDLIGFLDFAIIQVAGSPGSERGFYRFEQAVEPVDGGDVLLLQHPGGVMQRISRGRFTGFRDQTNNERLLHTANALEGSSGGLLVDGNHRLIGLHQGALPAKPGAAATSNTAISASAIRDQVIEQGAVVENSRFAHPFRLNDGRGPIIGRESCQQLLRSSTQPFIWVRSRSKVKGVTFSTELMRTCLPAGDHVIGTVEVADFHSDARRSAEVLLDALNLPSGGLPEEQAMDSSDGTWIAKLVQQVIERATTGFPGKTIWIVIDELLQPLPAGGCRDLLSELYRQVALTKNIKVVLLDLVDLPDGFPDHLLDDEDIAAPNRDDIARYVRRRLVARGCVYTGAEVDVLVNLIANTAGLEIEELARYIRRQVDPELDKWQVA